MDDPKPEGLLDNRIAKQDANNDFGLMTREAVATALGVSPKTVHNWMARREIPFVMVGRKAMFLREGIREWLRKKEFKPRGRY